MNLRARYAQSDQPVVTAHRGFSGRYPENTLLAFSKALELGVDIVEFDVRESADGRLVILHDALLDRTTNGNGPVDRFTLEDLKRLDASFYRQRFSHAGNLPSTVSAEVAIPTLEETLAALAGKVGLNIQVKTDSKKTLSEIVRLYLDYDLTESGFLMLKSFSQGTLVRSMSPDVAICIGEDRQNLERHLEFNVDYVQPTLQCLSDRFVSQLIKSGIPANVFFANDPETMSVLIDRGIPGIMTDFPDTLIHLIERRENAVHEN